MILVPDVFIPGLLCNQHVLSFLCYTMSAYVLHLNYVS